MTRHQHQQRRGMRPRTARWASQHLLLLDLMRAARDPYRPLRRELRAQPPAIREHAVRHREIGLEIAGDRNARGRHAQVREALRIGRGLRRHLHDRSPAPHAQGAREPAVAPRGAFRQARTRQHQRHLRRRAGTKQVRPDFRFQDDGQPRPHAPQESPHRAGQVQRHVAHRDARAANNARARASPAAVVAVTSSGSCASRCAQRRHQYRRGLHLAHGGGMQPHRRGQRRAQPEALAEAAPDPGSRRPRHSSAAR